MEQPKKKSRDLEFDEDHALDMAMNEMVKDLEVDDFEDMSATLNDGLDDLDALSKNDVEVIFEKVEESPEPNEKLKNAAKKFGSFGEPLVNKVEEPHLPKPGLTEQVIENRNVKPKVKRDPATGAEKYGKRGPLYSSRSSKRIADDDPDYQA